MPERKNSMDVVATLNFFPQYETLLRSKRKLTTIRFGDVRHRFCTGQKAILTVGWDQGNAVPVARATITQVLVKRVRDVTDHDLVGESPDCLSKESVKYVLSSIYRRVIGEDDHVSVVKWKYE